MSATPASQIPTGPSLSGIPHPLWGQMVGLPLLENFGVKDGYLVCKHFGPNSAAN